MAHNENALQITQQIANLLGVPAMPLALRLNYAINCGPVAVDVFFRNLAEHCGNAREVFMGMAEERMAARTALSDEAKAEIGMLEEWMDIPAYGREV